MNIGIDARPLIEKKTGFGYYLQNILTEILKIDKENTYYLFSDREIHFDSEKYINIRKVTYREGVLLKKTFYFYYNIAGFIDSQGIAMDVFWGTQHIMPIGFKPKVKRVLTIYDFTHILFPRSTTKFNLLVSHLFFRRSICNATDLICISYNTKSQLNAYFPKEIKNKNISMIYAGGLSDERTNKEDFSLGERLRTEIQELKNQRYVLFTGTIEPRKNISLLISAAPELKRNNIKIVLCGKIGWEKKSVIKKLYNTENLLYLNYVSEDERDFLMAHAICQVQPSLYEGFGLPVIESMQKGSVVVVANNSSLNELVELDYLKFKTTNPGDFCKKIISIANDEKLYKAAKKYCTRRGAEFSWEKAANKYLLLFQHA